MTIWAHHAHHTHAAQYLLLQKHLVGGPGQIRAHVHNYTAGQGYEFHTHSICYSGYRCALSYSDPYKRFCWKSSSLDFSAPGTVPFAVCRCRSSSSCAPDLAPRRASLRCNGSEFIGSYGLARSSFPPVGCGPRPLAETCSTEALRKAPPPHRTELWAWLLESDGDQVTDCCAHSTGGTVSCATQRWEEMPHLSWASPGARGFQRGRKEGIAARPRRRHTGSSGRCAAGGRRKIRT